MPINFKPALPIIALCALTLSPVVAQVVEEMTSSGEPVPEALAEKTYSGRFMVRIPSLIHRALATEAAEQGVSINRLVSAKLAM